METETTCQAPDCTGASGVRGLCSKHYQRWLRTGTLERYGNRAKSVDATCIQCGKSMLVQAAAHAKGEGKFCSRDCKYAARAGIERVVGTRHVRKDGYVTVKVGIRKYELEHRVVIESMIGRKLSTDEQVHHINGIKNDNRPENLQVLSNSEHQRLHDWPWTKPRRVEKTCEWCGAAYQSKSSRASESKFCSNRCRLTALHEGNRKV